MREWRIIVNINWLYTNTWIVRELEYNQVTCNTNIILHILESFFDHSYGTSGFVIPYREHYFCARDAQSAREEILYYRFADKSAFALPPFIITSN